MDTVILHDVRTTAMRYGYYNYKGERKGDFSGKEIKRLARAGIITPETIIETPEGDKYKAIGIEGVVFGNEHTDEDLDSSISLPEDWKVAMVNVAPVLPKWTQWLEEVEERKEHPSNFCKYISSTILTVHVIFAILFIESLIVTSAGLLILFSDTKGIFFDLSLFLSIIGVLQLPFIFLLRGLGISFLKSLRATFCHQFIVEQHMERHAEHVQRQAETLKYRGSVEGIVH
jgi:hypothetical protein